MKKSLISLAAGGFGIGMTEFVIMGILPEIATSMDITIPEAGHFISAYAIGVVVGAPLLTALGSKWPAHKMLIGLMVWFTVFNSLSGFANSYWSLMLFRFLSALPHGAFFGIGAVVASRLARPGKEAQAIAAMFSGLTLANIIGVPFGTYLGQEFHWSMAFFVVGIVGIITITSLRFWMPALAQSSEQSMSEDFQILKKAELWMVVLLTTIGTGGFFAWYSYIAPLITEVAGHDPGMVSYAMILAGCGMFAGNIAGAKLAEKMQPIYAVVLALGVMTLLLLANVYLAHDPVAVLVMTFIIGFGAFCVAAPIQMAMINTARGSEMLGSSLNQSAFNMGNASGAYLAGLPIAMGYGFTSADVVGALMAFAGVFLALGIIQMRKASRRKMAAAVEVVA
ncbi:MFS transporter [Marinoscillum sp. 108]|jgi:DHA1 family arabinose polymer transporter-like MFS transporter|uniref:MFS transporter n=1 Tax=Marinoscillum sp. 108 TaxID=2653151 RepID=UPI0012F1BC90|nr:MFS transporter [Marinoscillum sp. 108]VXD10525.1 MFS transporter [Marinoscillum sp. 108]